MPKLVYDTVYIEKEKEVPVYVTKYVEQENAPSTPNKLVHESIPERTGVAEVVANTPSQEDVKRSFGNTPLRAEEVEQFKVSL